MSWPHGPTQNERFQTNSFGSNTFSGQQAKGEGQGNKSNRGVPLYIINIPLDIDEEKLREMFSNAGDVISSKCLPPKEGRNSCVGFITYNTEQEAQNAISMFNNIQINRMTLRVDYTKSFKEGRTQKQDNAESPFSSGQQNQKSSYNGYSQRQGLPGQYSRESQPVDVHSIGRGIHYDNDSGNQFNDIGRGIDLEPLKSVSNRPGQGIFNQASSPAPHVHQNNNFESSDWETPSSNLNGPHEQSAKQRDRSFYNHGYQGKNAQDMQLHRMDTHIETNPVRGDPLFGNYNYQNVVSQDVASSYTSDPEVPQANTMLGGPSFGGYNYRSDIHQEVKSLNPVGDLAPPSSMQVNTSFDKNNYHNTEQTVQSTYSSEPQAPQFTTQAIPSFGSNYRENLPQNMRSYSTGTQIPSASTVQDNHSTDGTSQIQMNGLVNGFGTMQVTQPAGNHSFGLNRQYQVSSRLPRSQTGSGERTCHKCGEPGHFARECLNRSERGEGGGYHRFGEQGQFARECPNSGKGQEGSCPRPSQKVDYVPPPLPENVDLLFQAAVHKGINFDRFDNIPVEVTGKDPPAAIQTFDELLLPETLKSNLGKAEFTKPTPVQKYGIPIIQNGRDIMACAQTGSGKTVAFLLPVMVGMMNSRLPEASYLAGDAPSPAALCVAPTRELALQIFTEALKFSSGTYLRSVVCYGGVSVQHQLQEVERGCHILIGTPGRLIDFVGRNKVSLRNVRYLILDEADRMLDMGFENDIRKIVCQFGMPEKTQRQTLMFSATFPDEIQKLAREFLNDYLFLTVGRIGGSNLDIKQEILDLQNDHKRSTLIDILGESGTDKTLVFVERKRNADFLASWLSQNQYPTTSISGDRTQKEREDALRDFRDGRAPILIATSVAARGLDIPDVKHVINYDLPQQIEEYVHRIGRTGRIGNQGKATAFFEKGRDDKLARSLVKVLSDALQDVPNWLEDVAERALGTSYGPAGGKFASRDTRQFDSRTRGNTDTDDNSQRSPIENGGDEEEWD